MHPPAYLVTSCYFGLTFYTALLLSLLFTPISGKLARLIGVIDLPDSRKVHKAPIPRLGGIGMAGAMLLALVMCVKFHPVIQGYVAGLVLIVGTGLLDDKMGISPKVKFLGQIASVTTFCLIAGISLEHFGNILGFGDIPLGVFSLPVTVFCVVGVMNALNMSDGLDGLAAGISGVACLFLMPLAYQVAHWLALGVLTILLGVIIGFLRYNIHPARLFMGDTGSLFLGYTLGVLAIILTHPGMNGGTLQPVTLLTILSVPVVDTLYVMIRRIAHGRSPLYPDKSHLHHRLMSIGFKHPISVTVIYGLCIGMGVLAWTLRDFPEWTRFAVLLGMYAFFYAGLGVVEHRKKAGVPAAGCAQEYAAEGGELSTANPEAPGTTDGQPVRQRITSLTGRSARITPVVLWGALFIPLFLVPPISRPMGLLAFGSALFIFVLYPWRSGTRRMPLANALVFWCIFIILVFYEFVGGQSHWITEYLTVLSGLSLIWVGLRISFKPVQEIILPTSFELLLIAVAWLIPLFWVQVLDVDPAMQMRLIRACVLVIPVLAAAKAMMRRHARRNVKFVLGLQCILIAFGIKAFW